jgi:hypothetical protein
VFGRGRVTFQRLAGRALRRGHRAFPRRREPRARGLDGSSREECVPDRSWRCPRTTSATTSRQLQRPQWKARCYAFRAFPSSSKRRPRRAAHSGPLVFGGPLLVAPDRPGRTPVASARGPQPPGVRLRLGARFAGRRFHREQIPLRVARLNARTRSNPRRMRSPPDASAAAPPCADVPRASHRDQYIRSISSQRIRPVSLGTLQPRYGTFRTSQNVPKAGVRQSAQETYLSQKPTRQCGSRRT